MPEDKSLEIVEKIKGLFEEHKKTNDELLEKKASGEAVADLQQKQARIDEAFKSLEDELAEIKRKNVFNTANAETEDDIAHKSLFKLLKSGIGAIDESEEKALIKSVKESGAFFNVNKSESEVKSLLAGVDTQGGIFVPHRTEMSILKLALDEVALMRLATNKSIAGPSYESPVQLSEAGCLWTGETTPRENTEAQGYGKIKIEAYTLTAQPKITSELIEDSGINLESEIMQSLQRSFGQKLGQAFIKGTGAGQPKGILSYTKQNQKGKKGVDWGSIGYVPTGKAGAFADTNASDCLIDLVVSLKKPYHAGATWLMNSLSLAQVRKLKDSDGNYLWQPGLQNGTPFSLLGYSVEIDENMDDFATGSNPIAFGNFNRGYMVVNRRGMKIIRDMYTQKPFIVFSTDLRIGGGVTNFEAIKLLQASA